MGFSIEETINKLKQKDLVIITEINAQWFIIAMHAKLFEKSALGSTVLRCASIFDPTLMCLNKRSDLPKEKLQKRWKQLLEHHIVLGIIVPNRFDKGMAELKVFKDNEFKKMQSEFSGFFWKNVELTISASKLLVFQSIKNFHLFWSFY